MLKIQINCSCYNGNMRNQFNLQIQGLLEETDKIATLSNISACIYESYDNLNWAGFYFVKDNELILGPFQGKVACTHIPFDKGVCGKCYREKKTQCIDDVLTIQDHIACDSASRSELCVPIIVDDKVVGEIDIDSPITNRFTQKEIDEIEQVANDIAIAYKKNNWD